MDVDRATLAGLLEQQDRSAGRALGNRAVSGVAGEGSDPEGLGRHGLEVFIHRPYRLLLFTVGRTYLPCFELLYRGLS